jgi:peptide deformylase
MALLPIVRLGHPALRSVARPVEAATLAEQAFQGLIDDLIETMRDSHGVGLAAPQVGVPFQVFVYEVAVPRADPPAADPAADAGEESGPALAAVPLHVLVNPMLTPQAGNLVYDWEGCLSIPDLRGLVPRHPAVRVRGVDRHGEPLDYLAEGFEARIIQHEYDHLNGVVFLDRMRDFKALAFRDEWERYMADHGEGAPPSLPAEPELPEDIASAGEPGPAVAAAAAPAAAETLLPQRRE